MIEYGGPYVPRHGQLFQLTTVVYDAGPTVTRGEGDFHSLMRGGWLWVFTGAIRSALRHGQVLAALDYPTNGRWRRE